MTRRSRRIISLSEADRARLESGELRRPEDALGEPEPGRAGSESDEPTRPNDLEPVGSQADASTAGAAARPRRRAPAARRPSAADERLLREVPPHFGRI